MHLGSHACGTVWRSRSGTVCGPLTRTAGAGVGAGYTIAPSTFLFFNSLASSHSPHVGPAASNSNPLNQLDYSLLCLRCSLNPRQNPERESCINGVCTHTQRPPLAWADLVGVWARNGTLHIDVPLAERVRGRSGEGVEQQPPKLEMAQISRPQL